MKFRNVAPALAAMALVSAPVAAEAAGADMSRAEAPVERSSSLAAQQNTLVFFAGIAAVIAAVIFLAADDDDDAVSV
ncbi:hypothetical protein [Pseudopontixanthobacter vadosimaris]|uniref:hypothetical protein n=1 Tax=Pseudopontixanthobacter vadosimaris TaxID=2726450 RepID=UPI0014737D35|nr:hypothetical protein [Pseudopontixanthobacter vadosimaris]